MHFLHRIRDQWRGLSRLADPDDDLAGFYACPICQGRLKRREILIKERLSILQGDDQ